MDDHHAYGLQKSEKSFDQAVIPITKWGLDPLFNCFRKMLVADIRRKISTIVHEGVFQHYLFQRPVQKVEIMGIIARIVKPRKRCIYYVDDGTGLMRCTQYFSEQQSDIGSNDDVANLSLISLQLGSVVRVKGTLERTESDRENYGLALKVKMIDDCSRDRNMETVFKLEAIHLMETMYNKPYP